MTLKRTLKSAVTSSWALLVAHAVHAAVPDAPPTSPPAPPPMFEFHSGFWMNLHEFLYASASASRPPAGGRGIKIQPADTEVLKRLASAQAALWGRSVGYYARHYAARDPLTDDELLAVKTALESHEDSPDLQGVAVPQALKRVLLQAAPIYRSYWWPQHDTHNKRWVQQLQPLLDRDGAPLRQSLERLYGEAWPAQPVRVETVAYANWAGAYTTVEPTQPTISTSDPGYQGLAALEMLFHESSHGLIDKVQEAIDNATSTLPADKQHAVSMSLWHAVLFYTAGELVAARHPGYVPYAEQAGLWVRAWPAPVHALLTQDWKPHIDGTVTLDAAVTTLVRDLAEQP